AMFAAAKELAIVKESSAFKTLADFNALADETAPDPNGLRADLFDLKWARCCYRFATIEERNQDPICLELGDKFDDNECKESKKAPKSQTDLDRRTDFISRQENSFQRVIQAYNNYEETAYHNLNYKGNELALL